MNKSSALSLLVEVLEKIRDTTSKNSKVELLAGALGRLSSDDAALAARFATGRASVRGSKEETQVGYSTILGMLMETCRISKDEVFQLYLKYGDLGEVAYRALGNKTETSLFEEDITLGELDETFDRMADARGKGAALARKRLLKSLFLRATPVEGKYIAKILTREMRTGMVQGLLEEAIAKAYRIPKAEIARAHLLLGDVGLLALKASKGELGGIKLTPFRPANFMLAEPMNDPSEIAEHFQKEVFAEYKYDGVRAQIHKLADKVRLFSRRLEDITQSFPEVTRWSEEIKRDFIIDGEIVPFQGGKPLPFQLLQRRLRRIENFEEVARNAPVTYFAFDLLLVDNRECYDDPLFERTARLREIIEEGRLVAGIVPAERYPVHGAAQIEAVFRRSRELGYEGLVLKDPSSPYTMGKRGAGWIKLKEELDTIDAVIVAAEYGHGKRAGVISDYTFAVRDGEALKTIGKAYSGVTDQEIEMLTHRIKRLTTADYGYRRSVRPEIVIEVAFDSIQKSDRHDSGYALRFPRINRIREDKSVKEVDTIERVDSLFNGQKVKLRSDRTSSIQMRRRRGSPSPD